MELTKLETKEQFEKLKKGDWILVKWSDFNIKHVPGTRKVMCYKIYENKTRNSYTEIICQKRNNHYFNYLRYLENLSDAEEVYLIVGELEYYPGGSIYLDKDKKR